MNKIYESQVESETKDHRAQVMRFSFVHDWDERWH